jgi:programmed cell death 6-interacting protein
MFCNSIDTFLYVPFKKTESISLSEPLQSFIKHNYDNDPNAFSVDFKTLNQWRNEIIHLEPHVASINKLLRYCGQLVHLSSKFPINEHNVTPLLIRLNYLFLGLLRFLL